MIRRPAPNADLGAPPLYRMPASPAGDAVATMLPPAAPRTPAPALRRAPSRPIAAPRPAPASALAATSTAPATTSAVASAVAPVAERRAQFEREAMLHLDAMFSFALKLTRVRDDAEDLVHDTILRAFERWEQYRLGTNIRAWLFTILYHVFVSRKRRIDAREVAPIEQEDGWTGYEAVGELDPEGRFYDSFLDETISQAIERLPDEYRSAVVLSDVHQLRYAEIAKILGVPEGTVKSRLFRGRRILQKKLAAYAVEMGYLKALPRAS